MRAAQSRDHTVILLRKYTSIDVSYIGKRYYGNARYNDPIVAVTPSPG